MVSGKKVPGKMDPEKWSPEKKIAGNKVSEKKVSGKLVPGKMVRGKISSDSSEKLGLIFKKRSNRIKIVISKSISEVKCRMINRPLSFTLDCFFLY